jgi:hypothetical protein
MGGRRSWRGAGNGGIVSLVDSGEVTLNDWTLATGSKLLKQGSTYYVGISGKIVSGSGTQAVGVATSSVTLSVTIQSVLGTVTPFDPTSILSQITALSKQIMVLASKIPGAVPPETFSAVNKDVVSMAIGSICARDPSGTGVILAQATGVGKAAVGFCISPAIVGASTMVQVSGVLTLADWTAFTGSPTLSALSYYFLSATAGMIGVTPPGTGISQLVGTAISPNSLDMTINAPILL